MSYEITTTTHSKEWLSAQTVTALTERQREQHNALIVIELFTLRTAYPVQARNFSEQEFAALKGLWSELFAEVDPSLLHEAVKRFIITDRKAFFPSPGQIVAVIEQIISEREIEQERRATEQHYAWLEEHERRIENGENCSTCQYCDHRRELPNYSDAECKAYMNAPDCEKKQYMVKKLYCQNPASNKYEGDKKSGTTASMLCDLYKMRSK